MPIDITEAEKAISEAKEKGKGRNFRQSIDVYFNLRDLDVKDQKNRIVRDVLLPKGLGTQRKVCVIASGDLALRSEEAGAGVLTREDLGALAKDRKKVKELANQYDYFVAQADMMPLVGRTLGSVLGPRGKMPKPIPPNASIKGVLTRLANTVTIRTQREQPIINATIGNEEMDDRELAENLAALVESVESALPRGEQNIKSILVKTTMGPPVRVK